MKKNIWFARRHEDTKAAVDDLREAHSTSPTHKFGPPSKGRTALQAKTDILVSSRLAVRQVHPERLPYRQSKGANQLSITVQL
jgi:hypothetical protein